MTLPNPYTAVAAALAGLLVIVAIAVPIKNYGDKRFDAGKADVQAEWDAAVARGKADVERLKTEATKVTVKTETIYVDRIKTIREKGNVIERRIPYYVAADVDLPGGWRLLHDDAAAGTVSDAADLADAAPVDAQTAAAGVTDNYLTCHETRQQLVSLQDWVYRQCRANPPPEGCGPAP